MDRRSNRNHTHLSVIFIERFGDLLFEAERLVRLLSLPLGPVFDPQVVRGPRRYSLTLRLRGTLVSFRFPGGIWAFAGRSSVSNHLFVVWEGSREFIIRGKVGLIGTRIYFFFVLACSHLPFAYVCYCDPSPCAIVLACGYGSHLSPVEIRIDYGGILHGGRRGFHMRRQKQRRRIHHRIQRLVRGQS